HVRRAPPDRRRPRAGPRPPPRGSFGVEHARRARVFDARAWGCGGRCEMSRSGASWSDWSEQEGDEIRAAGRWRAPRDFDAAGPEGKLAPDGRPVVSFASNDYLGLTQHPAVVAAAHT